MTFEQVYALGAFITFLVTLYAAEEPHKLGWATAIALFWPWLLPFALINYIMGKLFHG